MRTNTLASWIVAMAIAGHAAPAVGECNDPGKVPSRFRVNGVELTDTRTGLIWLRCPGAYVTPLGECDPAMVLPSSTWAGAMADVRSPPAPPGKWHLASLEELEGVVAKGCGRLFDPKVIELLFENVWTSSEAGDGTVWLLDSNGARHKLSKAPRDPRTGGQFFAQSLYVRATDATSSQAAGRPTAAPPLRGSITVLIGTAGPLSNRLSALGKDSENGVRLAIDEANEAGISIGGRAASFVLVSEDDRADANVASAVAQRLVDAKVAGVIGHLDSRSSMAASLVYDKSNVPMIAAASTNPALSERGLKNVFRVIARGDSEVPAIARMLLERGRPKTVLIVDDGSLYGEGVATAVEAALRPHARIDRRKWNAGATDAVLDSIRALNPEVIFFGGMEDTVTTFVPQARQASATALLAVGDAACSASIASIGAAADGLICPNVVEAISAVDRHFVEAYRAKFNAAPIAYSPYSYDATKVLIEAIRRAGSASPRDYLPELRRTQYAGATGAIAFDGKGDRRDPDVTILEVRNGTLAPVAIVRGGRTVVALGVEAPGQAVPSDAEAKLIVDRFVAAMKTAAEGTAARQRLRELSWVDIRPTELNGERTLEEGIFDTDIPSIKGYKRVIETKVRTQGPTEALARYVVIVYRDRREGNWKVFEIRDLKGSNAGYAAEAAARDLDGGTGGGGKRQVKYRRYAYWLALDGKVGKARQAYERAVELNNSDPDPNWEKFETGRYQALKAITGN